MKKKKRQFTDGEIKQWIKEDPMVREEWKFSKNRKKVEDCINFILDEEEGIPHQIPSFMWSDDFHE